MEWLLRLLQQGSFECAIFLRVVETPDYDNISRSTGQGLQQLRTEVFMIPISLRITGFLSYKEPVELDFSSFSLACISGFNGAGKSSILDAITWGLFGQARKRDDSLLHTHPEVKMAEVVFTFQYEEQVYRVIRTLPKGRNTLLEFQIQSDSDDDEKKIWRSISEHGVRETQNRIRDTLRLDYETFVNAAFFLQGKADQFAQQQPGKRKEILGNILGLEIWDDFREKTNVQRRLEEHELAQKDGQIQEILQELSEESDRKKHLNDLEEKMVSTFTARRSAELNLEQMRKVVVSLDQLRNLTMTLKENLDRSSNNKTGLIKRRDALEEDLQKTRSVINRADQITSSYEKSLDIQMKLEEMDELSQQFKKLENESIPMQKDLDKENTRLEYELRSSRSREKEMVDLKKTIPGIKGDISTTRKSLIGIEEELSRLNGVRIEIQSQKQLLGELSAASENLKIASVELKERVGKLRIVEGANCPLCGQLLNQAEKDELINKLEAEVSSNRKVYKENLQRLKDLSSNIKSLESELTKYQDLDNNRLSISSKITVLEENLKSITNEEKIWEDQSTLYQELSRMKEKGLFLPEVRSELEKIHIRMNGIGYDSDQHDKLKETMQELRSAHKEFTELSVAEGTKMQAEKEVESLENQIQALEKEIKEQTSKYNKAHENLMDSEKNKPDIISIQAELGVLQNQENQLNREIGAARQRVSVLKTQKKRKSTLEIEREQSAKKIESLRTLERAFGKEGVPALLIEQALPEIENKANEILERLSNGTMSIRFQTQAAYKDKKRRDLKETLEILIMDESGVRDYEMFSGGEAFRVNFAIRLALSKVLAHRKGARLQTLVIDEGFGSQDILGRQRLVEAINSVKDEFEKILIITHLDELKDVFQTQIHVTKTETGSVIEVV
ncbi:AAA family ATPase [Chloroflexota bacterium]